MRMTDEFAEVRARWKQLSLYQKFEHTVIFILSSLIAILVVVAVWNLVLKVFASIFASGFDPTDYSAFQAVFGMIFTVIIALEFERSLLVIAERDRGVVQVRTVILIALLAIVRKLMIMDMSIAEVQQLFALAIAVLALGGVYWLVRDQDRRENA
ncbi:MAG TPA: phosphate-starvation-inducible PsiE family protein [Lacipirellulaceae bacterium]|nr:phosphate-starvation-inducible PsiE family protein [Lacipirellulaceae bacterium]